MNRGQVYFYALFITAILLVAFIYILGPLYSVVNPQMTVLAPSMPSFVADYGWLILFFAGLIVIGGFIIFVAKPGVGF